MPSTPQRGFIVRPTQDNTEPVAEPEFDSVNIQVGPDHYSFTREEVVSTGRWGVATSWNIPVPSDTVSSRTVEERIKDRMLEKIEEFLESNQLNELSVLAAVYQQFKELHP